MEQPYKISWFISKRYQSVFSMKSKVIQSCNSIKFIFTIEQVFAIMEINTCSEWR